MFRIESYITPIILDHVAKYVKNIRPQDAQLSLWEGEVTLQNLDLRLDVLEEELQMPFEFLSGHIHELSIRVPWTKITSEPIRIIINTIEFVLKLKRDGADGGSSSTGSSPQRKDDEAKKRKRASKTDEQQLSQQSPLGGSGIVSKIINNISLECQNIILKYVEDDIVVSMNVQLLQFSSADENWKTAMTDVHPVKVLIRKLIKVSDLTICLDKRNSAGHIEVCQEPILYRCSLELRVFRKHNINTMDISSATRIGIFTKSLDMNISSMQFPLVMRLIQMITVLGHAKTKSTADEQHDESVEEQRKEEEERGSILLWAWNRLPSFSAEPPDPEETCSATVAGHFKDFGLYIGELHFTLKNSELVVDTIMSNAKRIRYTPIARITLGGMYCEHVSMEEQNWHNLKAGITYILVDPLGPYQTDDSSDMSLIQNPLEKISSTYIDSSLFDEKTCGKERSWSCANFDEYMSRYTDEYLLHRTPIFAFDSIQYKTPRIRDPNAVRKEPPNMPIKDTHLAYRVLSSGVIFRWNHTFLQVKNIIQDLIDSYDYQAYYADRIDSATPSATKLPPPLMEDFDDLMTQIPICIYKFDLKNISIEVYAQVEPTATQKTQHRLPSTLKQTMPYFVLHFDHLDGTLSKPLYPDKLVHTTCQLPDKPRVLIDVCYKNYDMHLRKFSISMVNRVKKSVVRLLHVPHIQMCYGDLLQKEHWEEDAQIPKYKLNLQCETIEVDFSKRDVIVGEQLFNCLFSYCPHLLWKVANQTLHAPKGTLAATMHSKFNGLFMELRHYSSYTMWSGSLQSLHSEVVSYHNYCFSVHTIFKSETGNTKRNWLQLQAQRNPHGIEATPNQKDNLLAVLVTVEPYKFFVDVALLEFLKYQEENYVSVEKEASSEVELQTQALQTAQTHTNTNIPARPHAAPLSGSAMTATPTPLLRRSSRNSLPSRKISHPEETIHFSSERDEKLDVDVPGATTQPTDEDPDYWWKYIKFLAISIEISQGRILIAEEFKRNVAETLCTEIALPKITLKSTNAENLSHVNLREKFSISAVPKDTVNWIITLYSLGVRKVRGTNVESILADVYTTITIAITHIVEDVDNLPPLSAAEKVANEGDSEAANAAPNEVPPATTAPSVEGAAQSGARAVDSINVHVDITPIHIQVSEAKCKILQLHMCILRKVLKLMRPMAQINVRCVLPTPPIQIIPAAEENAAIKQFLDLETSSISSVLSEHKKVSPHTFSLFCQWTIAKIIIELQSTPKERVSRIVLELEDLLATIDKREDFTKYTSKVGQCNLNYYEPDPHTEWVVQPYLRIKMFGEVANLPFLNIVYTCVGLKSFYSRIGIKRKGDSERCISEILITIQAMEVIIDLERLKDFVGSLSLLFLKGECKKCPKNIKPAETVANPLTSADLPLIHLDSKGFTIYTPMCTGRECCTVIIWKIESIKVSPNLENPLQRNPIRCDVYSKAAQMGLLNTPGSLIEDRQYELVLQNISVASGHWEQILNHMVEQEKSFYHTNPALEWNSQNRKPLLHLTDIFNNFNFIGIFAPCIVYNNILICGQSVEFNCASDFIATMDTDQLHALSLMATRFLHMFDIMEKVAAPAQANELSVHSDTSNAKSNSSDSLSAYMSNTKLHSMDSISTYHSFKSNNTLCRLDQRRSIMFKEGRSSSQFDSIDEGTEQLLKTDSGFQSNQSRTQGTERAPHTERCDGAHRHIPQTVALLAGTFLIQFFEIEPITTESGNDECQQHAEQHVNRKRSPLVLFTISQPSFMFMQNIHDSVTQISLFNFNIHIPNGNAAPADSTTPLFPIEILSTHPGELSTTGIPPPLATLRKHITKQKLIEMDMETAKPIVISLHEAHVQRLLRNTIVLYETAIKSGLLEARSARPIQRSSKISLIRSRFFGADRFHARLEEMIVIAKNDADYNCKLVCADMQLNGTFLLRPEKAALKSAIGSIYLQAGEKIFLHPIALRSSVMFVSETWHELPLINATIKFDVIQVDVDVSGLQELERTMAGLKRVAANADAEWKQFLRRRPPMNEPASVQPDNLVILKYPSMQKFTQKNDEKEKKKRMPREEFYQDDLRAGAFQFVEMVTDAFLPLPYQIQIIKKHCGIICWRYPQPRKMCKIQIFPVPMAVQEPVNIKCRIEYFSESHECFLFFSDFVLSESASQEIALPEREICANIWRVVIMQLLVSVDSDCFDPNESEEDKIPNKTIEDIFTERNKDSDFILHPRLLVGCMRIDTSFQSNSVPKVQVLVSCTSLQLKLFNQTNENRQLPPLLAKYRLQQTKQISQAFLVVHLERLSVHGAFNSWFVYCVDGTLTLGVKCLDYGYLNMLTLMEEATLQSFVYVNKPKRMLNVNMMIDKLRLNVGPSIIHSLVSSKAQWQELLDAKAAEKRYVVLTKCTVVNLMRSQVSFGQTGTTERIQLLPMECNLYCFGNDYYNQELTFFIADDETHMTEASQSIAIPLKLDEERKLQPTRIGDKCLTIEFRKLSSTQIIVFLKGQIELISMVPQQFRVEFHCESQKQEKKKPFEYLVESEGCGSFYWAVQSSSNIAMILKFGSSKGKGRSGDIPLKTNKKLPWLVKVPTVDNNFVSLWVRVVREDIQELCNETFRPQKVLVTIWPIFEVRSMLSFPLKMKELETEQNFTIAARAGRQVLSVPATHLTDHKFNFHSAHNQECACGFEHTLTLKTMQWNNFFWYDEQIWGVENALFNLSESNTPKWPFDDEDELRVKRNSLNVVQPDLVHRHCQSREFSCTVCLEISAWGMFINASGADVSICDNNKLKERVHIGSNCVEMIPTIVSCFTVDLPQDTDWVSSLPIYCEGQALPSGARYYVLPENASIDIVIVRETKVFKFVLELKIEDKRHILRLRPKYSIVNFTKSKLEVLSFAMDHKENAQRKSLEELDAKVDKIDLDCVNTVENCIGRTLDSFIDFKPSSKSKRSKDTAFVCFVCVKVNKTSDLSIPIPLSIPFTRRCFSIQNGEKSIPLAATLIEKDRVYYLNIFEDHNSAFLISNQTDVKFLIAQTSASENSKVSNTTPEYDGRHFEWYQRLPAFSSTYYTPPELYANFPDVEFSMCNITLALHNESETKKKLKWSKPIRTDRTWEKFLFIPNHGDVKVIICDQHRVIRVFIYYIAQLEFSVKDLRSRLSTPQSHSPDESLVSITPSTAIMDTFTLRNTPAKCKHFTNEDETKTQLKVRLYVKETVLSFHTDAKECDFIKSDIIGLYVDDFMIAYDDDDDKKDLHVVIPNLQLDNRIHYTGKYDFPVVLCAQETYERFVNVPSVHYLDHTYQSLADKRNMVHCTLGFFEDELKLRSIRLKLSPIRTYIEDAYLNDLLDVIVESTPRNCVYKSEQCGERISLSKGEFLLPHVVTAQAILVAEPLQLRSFQIESLNMLLSVHTSMRLYIALDHSPLSFSTYNRQQILTVPLRFGQSLSMHYLSGAIFGAGWVVGSLEILGSPSGLARSFTTGLRDFVSMPMQGLFRGPWGFIVGVTQGSASLLRNVTAGTVNSVSKLAASVARNLDRLTLDQEHIERTEALRRCRPHGFTEGFSQGITGLGISILGAVGGLARHTLEARTPVEVVTGVGKGIVGALTKPLSGAAELVALAGQGMLHTVGFNTMPELRSPCICHNIVGEPSPYRIWKLLPDPVKSDQILFNHEVTLVAHNQLRRGYAVLTSTVFAIMEVERNDLLFVIPIEKVEMTSDCTDRTLYYIHLVKEREGADEDNYTNQRIITYLHSSTSLRNMSATASGSLSDLLQCHEQELQANRRKKLDWAFHINETLGEHIVKYLKLMNRNY